MAGRRWSIDSGGPLEPVFEADFQEGSYGYRPKRTAHQAVHRVATAVVQNKTMIIDD